MQSFDQAAATVRDLAGQHFGPLVMGQMSAAEFAANLEAAKAAILCEPGHLSLDECLADKERYSDRLWELHRRSEELKLDYVQRRAAREVRHAMVLAVIAESQCRAKARRAA